MKLFSVTDAVVTSPWCVYRLVLDWILRSCYGIVFESTVRAQWPQSWSDNLFVPQRNFDQRKRARRFLGWLVRLGVDAGRWLDQVESGAQEMSLPPPAASTGGVGRAYFIGDKVVKLTTDAKEAQRASALSGMDVPNLAKVYGVAEIEGVSVNKQLFALVMDRVPDKIPGKYRVAANAVYSYLDDYDRPIVDVDRAATEITTRYLPDRYRDDQDVRRGVLKILRATDAVYRRTGIMLQDPHGGNVLLRGGDVQFFDLGRSSDYGQGVPAKQIQKIA